MPSAEPHDVIQELSGAIARDPTDVQARFRRGNAYSNLGEYARAIEDMDCVLELEPDDRVARNNRGMAYLCIGEFESALPDLYRAIELDPEYRDAYHNRGPRVLRARAAGGGRGRPDAGHKRSTLDSGARTGTAAWPTGRWAIGMRASRTSFRRESSAEVEGLLNLPTR